MWSPLKSHTNFILIHICENFKLQSKCRLQILDFSNLKHTCWPVCTMMSFSWFHFFVFFIWKRLFLVRLRKKKNIPSFNWKIWNEFFVHFGKFLSKVLENTRLLLFTMPRWRQYGMFTCLTPWIWTHEHQISGWPNDLMGKISHVTKYT